MAESAADNYRTYCLQCHGTEANGMGMNVQAISVQPADHTASKVMSTRTDAELFRVIKEGGIAINRSALMPPWTATLIKDLVHYLRTLCKCKQAG
ncbi:MAG: cytochrome c [Mariprofundus sp.]